MSKIKNALLVAAVAGATAAVNNPATSATTGDRRIIAESVLKEIEPVVLNATNMEPWYQSRVTWGAILAGVAGVLGVLGYGDLLPAELQGRIVEGAVAAAPLISAGVVIYGRWAARRPIGS